ncbi:hypothetical protein SAMN04489844_2675 [Nocardioides exalbidus]|uniref:DUF35 domain-containing protein n=1 Tax=Nocardioides exalbidus TaxID=402596 RepID=A0A1H4U4B2_9ACTN|nr:OB-fold domain-containing protein [Nocardioides exalbidus]SEC63575.1 hypothetical protein SAMN04489844_2675 [Nocardioides exalbidus]
MTILETFADLSVAPPTPTAESQPWWDALRAGRFTVQSCGACGAAQGYPRTRCVRCWSDDLSLVDATGRAELVTHSEVHRPGQASWGVLAPYYVGLVRLEEGATLLTHLLTDDLPDDRRPRVGDRCDVVPTRVGEWVLPFFRVRNSVESTSPERHGHG